MGLTAGAKNSNLQVDAPRKIGAAAQIAATTMAKEAGTAHFKAGEYHEALARYSTALDDAAGDDVASGSLQSNISACHAALKDFPAALAAASARSRCGRTGRRRTRARARRTTGSATSRRRRRRPRGGGRRRRRRRRTSR